MDKDKIKGIVIAGILCMSAAAGTVGMSKATAVENFGEEYVSTPSDYAFDSMSEKNEYDDYGNENEEHSQYLNEVGPGMGSDDTDSEENGQYQDGGSPFMGGDDTEGEEYGQYLNEVGPGMGIDDINSEERGQYLSGDSPDGEPYDMLTGMLVVTPSDCVDESDSLGSSGGYAGEPAEGEVGSYTESGDLASPVTDFQVTPEPSATGIATYASATVDWVNHSWSASYNGTNLVLSLNIDFYAIGAPSETQYPNYFFGDHSARTYIINCNAAGAKGSISKSQVTSDFGTLNLTEFIRTSGSVTADGDKSRHLKMVGTITVPSGKVQALSEVALQGHAGLWGVGTNAYSSFGKSVPGLDTAVAQAKCGHTLTYTSNGAGGHTVKCSKCGYTGTQAHTMSGSTCTKCKYTSTVSITLRYIRTKETTSETLTLTPNQSYQPKSFTGYRKPAAITVPTTSKTVDVRYTPIAYTINDGSSTITLNYDQARQLPAVAQKGYTHSSYQITGVS